LNFWFSSSLDLFGADASSNAASYFANGIKGRPDEKRYADHIAAGTTFDLEIPAAADGVRIETIPMRNAMNEVVRNSYVDDCMRGLTHWNRILEAAGHAYRFSLPSTRFRRTVGSWAERPHRPRRCADFAGGLRRVHLAVVAARAPPTAPSWPA
jgi:benzoyl-CoA 2,3-dioxygenase component B